MNTSRNPIAGRNPKPVDIVATQARTQIGQRNFAISVTEKNHLFPQNRFLDILFHFHKWNLQKMEAPLLGKIPKNEKYFID